MPETRTSRRALSAQKFNALVGAQLAKARLATGLTQYEVADRMESTAQHISDVENGKVSVSIHWAYRFAYALGTRFTAIFEGEW